MAPGDTLSVEDVSPVGIGDTVPHTASDELLAGTELAGLVLPVDELLLRSGLRENRELGDRPHVHHAGSRVEGIDLHGTAHRRDGCVV